MIAASFHPAAEEEVLAAVTYYESQATGLGRAFLLEADRTLEMIRRFPEIGPAAEGAIRQFPFARFPFSYLYRLSGGSVRVIAVRHHRQRPGQGLDRA